MKHLGSIDEWMLFECTQTAGEMLRVAYDREEGTRHHVCDSADYGWDPDPMIPQPVIDMHIDLTVRRIPS